MTPPKSTLQSRLLKSTSHIAWASLLCFTLTALGQQPPITRTTRDAVTSGNAQLVGRLPASQSMQVVLVLPLRDPGGLAAFLEDVYNPASPSFRRFLTVEQFTERFGPSQEDYDTAARFARSSGLEIVGTSSNRLNLVVKGSVSQIESAFHVSMEIYRHPTENRKFYAPDREPTPNLPFRLWRIAGLDNYSTPRPTLLKSNTVASGHGTATTGSGPGASFLGSDMRAAYYTTTPGETGLTGRGQSLGLLEYAGTDLADLTTYFSNVHQTNNVPITLTSTDGTSTSCVDSEAGGYCDDTEQTLDMTQAIGMAPGLSGLVMYVGSTDAAILNAMATAESLNKQLSSSWTWKPSSPTANDQYFEEFAAQGQSFFQAAGDWGTWTATLYDEERVYPADSQYVTSVGGTDLETASAGGAWKSPETVWVDTGGGVSPSPDEFAVPTWQLSAALGCPSCSAVYRDGPDVAANANFTFYVCADQTTCSENLYGGTSFAAPMWAGLTALANQQYAATNSGMTLGFLNPYLYSIGQSPSYASTFHDITSGNDNCNPIGNGYCSTLYYSAAKDYDLVTGWGTPIGQPLINALVNNPVCTAIPVCVGSGSFGQAGISLSCSKSAQISTSAELCSSGCQSENGPSGLLTYSSASVSGNTGGSGYCQLSWCVSGYCPSVRMNP